VTAITTLSGSAVAVVRLWRLELDLPAERVQRASRFLTQEEQERERRFRARRDRDRYVAGRGQLREVLAGLTGGHAAELELTTGAFGKPELPGSGLFFNLAHAEGRALLAVTEAGRIGVDLERLHPVADRDLVAERFFAAAEVDALRRAAPALRDSTFLRCWTRKEAYVKAVGGGLSVPLGDFAVATGAADAPGIVWSRNPSERLRWSVLDLSHVVPGHLAAAVVEKPPGSRFEITVTTERERP